jgi:anti-sigma B factor antagonist
MGLSTTFAEEQGGLVLRVSLNGSLDGTTAPMLDADLSTRISSKIGLLILDMKKLNYISSAGLRVVFKTAKSVRALGGSLALANRQPQIIKVFEIVKALPDLRVFDNDEEMDKYLTAMQDRSREKDQ